MIKLSQWKETHPLESLYYNCEIKNSKTQITFQFTLNECTFKIIYNYGMSMFLMREAFPTDIDTYMNSEFYTIFVDDLASFTMKKKIRYLYTDRPLKNHKNLINWLCKIVKLIDENKQILI